jgi:N-acyl-D-aspartate/D-glutamate deacylase
VGDRIAAVGDLGDAVAERTINASGQVVAPGFVDVHGHSDIAALSSPAVPSKLHQGVTTEIMGNCGLSVCPASPGVDITALRAQMAIVDVDHAVAWDWRSTAQYLARLADNGTAMNVAVLAGHLPMRVSCVGYENRAASQDELAAMQQLADRALADGAIGVSTGLMYAPNAYADLDELVALGEVVAHHGAIFSMHLRDYADCLVEAVTEGIAVARRTGCRVQLSHLSVVGRRNFGKVGEGLRLVDAACAEGLDVAVDTHTYLAGSTNLTQLLPRWSLEGGPDALRERLRDPGTRDRIATELSADRRPGWDEVLIAGMDGGDEARLVGRSIAELATAEEVEPTEMYLRLAERFGGSATILAFGRSPDVLREVLRHPRTMIGSDGLGLDPRGASGHGRPHPRSYGCYPRLLGRYVREEQVLTLEQAVHKSTYLAAQRFAIPDRGLIASGRVADLVVFDPAQIADQSSYADPQRYPTGIRAVVVAGQVAIDDGAQTQARAGAVLRRVDADRQAARV